MVNLKPTLVKTIMSVLIFLSLVYAFRIRLGNSSCEILCKIPNCPPCAYPVGNSEIILWGIVIIAIPALFYMVYSAFQRKEISK